MMARSCFPLAAAVVAAFCAAHAAEPLQSLAGRWQVESLDLDMGATARHSLDLDDPRLVGRLMDIGPDKITLTGVDSDAVCVGPSFSETTMSAGELIARSMAGRGTGTKTPLPADYRLPMAPGTQVTVDWLACGSGLLAPDFRDKGDTFFLRLPDHRVAVGYYGSTILVLARTDRGDRPTASFDCARAATATEKAICGSVDLASLDRSIAASYADARQWNATPGGENVATRGLKTEQTAWLRSRDRCGGDKKCLRTSMNRRLLELAKDSGYP